MTNCSTIRHFQYKADLCLCLITRMCSMARVSAVLLILFIQTVTGQVNSPAPAPELICGLSQIQIGLRPINIEFHGLNGTSGHLADLRCSSFTEQNGTVWYQVERRAGTCGNLLTTNSTHATYINSLFVYHAKNYFSPPVSYPFSCVYPLNTMAFSQAINPVKLLPSRIQQGPPHGRPPPLKEVGLPYPLPPPIDGLDRYPGTS